MKIVLDKKHIGEEKKLIPSRGVEVELVSSCSNDSDDFELEKKRSTSKMILRNLAKQ